LNGFYRKCLSKLSFNEGYSHLIKILTDILDEYEPEKEIIIKEKNIIREEWMLTGLRDI